jgi:hypothetical protein
MDEQGKSISEPQAARPLPDGLISAKTMLAAEAIRRAADAPMFDDNESMPSPPVVCPVQIPLRRLD